MSRTHSLTNPSRVGALLDRLKSKRRASRPPAEDAEDNESTTPQLQPSRPKQMTQSQPVAKALPRRKSRPPQSAPRSPTEQQRPLPADRIFESYAGLEHVPHEQDGQEESATEPAPSPDEAQQATPSDTPAPQEREELSLKLEALEPAGNLQEQLQKMVDELIGKTSAVDGFIADRTGLPMTSGDSAEDCAARSSLAWRLFDAQRNRDLPDYVAVAPSNELVTNLFLVDTEVGPMAVGLRKETSMAPADIDAVRTALTHALHVAE